MPVDLTDGELFARAAHRAALARLRSTHPVYRHPEPDGPGFWVLTRYRDVVATYADHDTFSSRHGMRLGSDPAAVAAVAGRMLIVTDPPDHRELRRIVGGEFGPTRVAAMATLVDRVVGEVLDDLAAALGDGAVVDLVEIVKDIPNRVVCAVLGLPRSDWAWVGALTTGAFESDDETERTAAHSEIFLYLADLVAARRAAPGADVISRIAAATGPAGHRLAAEDVVLNLNGVLAGANETTRHAASGAVLAFGDHPGQWRRLRTGGPAAVAGAVEEVLRWTTPGVHALRTATRDTVLDGVPVRAGDRVTLWNAAANFDPAEFPDPDRFDIARSPNRHLTFGWGRHVCLGARLARMELAAFLGGLAERFAALEPAGPPRWVGSNFTWGLRRLPVRARVAAVSGGRRAG